MTREEFSRWIEERGKRGRTHYEELVAVAFERTRTSEVPLTDRQGRPLDIGQAEAEATVQGAVTRALDSSTLAELDPAKAWPWMVDAIRSVAEHTRRGAKRASKTHRQWAGAFLAPGITRERGTHTKWWISDGDNTTVRKAPRVVAVDPDQNDDENGHDFIGPRGAWKGEYTLAHIGPCGTCGASGTYPTDVGAQGGNPTGRYVGQSWSRAEIGRDRERLGYSKRWTVEALMAIEHAVKDSPANSLARLAGFALGCVAADSASRTVHRTFQALGCWNGHRTYTGEMP